MSEKVYKVLSRGIWTNACYSSMWKEKFIGIMGENVESDNATKVINPWKKDGYERKFGIMTTMKATTTNS